MGLEESELLEILRRREGMGLALIYSGIYARAGKIRTVMMNYEALYPVHQGVFRLCCKGC